MYPLISATEAIEQALHNVDVTRTCAMSSFGKDSLVLLSLLREYGNRQVLHAEGPDERSDPLFIEQTKKRLDLDVTILPKGRSFLYFVQRQPFFLSFPHCTARVMLPFPTTMAPFVTAEEPYICLDQELRADESTVPTFEADVIFFGQKASDLSTTTCQIWQTLLQTSERAKLAADMTSEGAQIILSNGVKLIRPLVHWTDDDVWDYIEEHEIPTSALMYTGRNRLHYSMPTCYRCHDPFSQTIVECPRLGRKISNISPLIRQHATSLDHVVELGLMTRTQQQEFSRG